MSRSGMIKQNAKVIITPNDDVINELYLHHVIAIVLAILKWGQPFHETN